MAVRVLSCLSNARQLQLVPLLSKDLGTHLDQNISYPEGSVGRFMESAHAVFSPDVLVTDAVEQIRPIADALQVTYAYVTAKGKLVGLVAMREMLFASPGDTMSDIMVIEPFHLVADAPHEDAMKAVVRRHYPSYPVCDREGILLGIVRGYILFEQQTYELTAQAGRMVGVEKEERLNTPWLKSFLFRHPWLQLNLLTAFMAGAVVGLFEDTIQQIVVLAAFLPVLAGQSGNTGCQALAITLRSMTLNELKPGMEGGLLRKEAVLGMSNGLLVGLTAGAAMLGYAFLNDAAEPLMLAGIILVAMTASCAISGVAGVLIPLTMRKLGADPATASTIFLTTATDIVSMGAMLGLATIIML
ncbi:MAG: magnesium transporter [Proteobacteria bacterium]|nr:magnesium transporter [Pseudomonadota bacterium]